MPKPAQPNKPSAEQRKLADQKWAQLEAQLDKEMQILGPSRDEVGRILYEMKLLLKKFGLNKGRRGRWQAVLRKHEIDRKTAENWIRMYQEKAGIPAHKLVVAAGRKSQQNGQKNTVNPTALGPDPWIEAAKEDEQDRSPEGRLAIECCFVLTLDEKRRFMDAVEKLGELRATQLMYQAVVSATKKTEVVGAGA